MSLDVETPEPPELDYSMDVSEYDDVTVVSDADYRREELDAFIQDGAWTRAFNEWAEHTDVTPDEWQIVLDLGLLREYDFFWDDFANRVGYHAPGIPEDWRERNLHVDLTSWGMVSSINAGLTELGQTVSDLLKTEYVDWNAEFEAPDDLPNFDA